MAKAKYIVTASLLLWASSAWPQPPGMGAGLGAGMMGRGAMPGCDGIGYGMGYGMGRGTGRGMMWGYGPEGGGRRAAIPNLTSDQRGKLADADKQFREKQRQLMDKMHDLGARSGGLYRNGKFDEQAARKHYEAVAALRQQMFDNYIDEQKRIDSFLTPQQREQVQRDCGG